ncbi:MAG: hypothetical protein PHG80_12730 [Methanoregulaceae archaeon]|jgi:hypothetical protein|nr:hypothetical protein [Methanoregulaceae archaeon]
MTAVGLVVGIVWTVVFGPLLARVRPERRNWYAYSVEAVGVFVIACFLEHSYRLTPLTLLSGMIFAGIGMFVAKVIRYGTIIDQ